MRHPLTVRPGPSAPPTLPPLPGSECLFPTEKLDHHHHHLVRPPSSALSAPPPDRTRIALALGRTRIRSAVLTSRSRIGQACCRIAPSFSSPSFLRNGGARASAAGGPAGAGARGTGQRCPSAYNHHGSHAGASPTIPAILATAKDLRQKGRGWLKRPVGALVGEGGMDSEQSLEAVAALRKPRHPPDPGDARCVE